jgi:hypothetical protein
MAGRRRPRRAEPPRRPRLAHWRADGQAKARFSSEQEANRAAFGYRLEHGTDLAAYRCDFCGGWHLGNRPDD